MLRVVASGGTKGGITDVAVGRRANAGPPPIRNRCPLAAAPVVPHGAVVANGVGERQWSRLGQHRNLEVDIQVGVVDGIERPAAVTAEREYSDGHLGPGGAKRNLQ